MRNLTLSLSIVILGSALARAEDRPPLAGVRRVVFLGDSITYAGQYVEYVEAYLRARDPALRCAVFQSWSAQRDPFGPDRAGPRRGGVPKARRPRAARTGARQAETGPHRRLLRDERRDLPPVQRGAVPEIPGWDSLAAGQGEGGRCEGSPRHAAGVRSDADQGEHPACRPRRIPAAVRGLRRGLEPLFRLAPGSSGRRLGGRRRSRADERLSRQGRAFATPSFGSPPTAFTSTPRGTG